MKQKLTNEIVVYIIITKEGSEMFASVIELSERKLTSVIS